MHVILYYQLTWTIIIVRCQWNNPACIWLWKPSPYPTIVSHILYVMLSNIVPCYMTSEQHDVDSFVITGWYESWLPLIESVPGVCNAVDIVLVHVPIADNDVHICIYIDMCAEQAIILLISNNHTEPWIISVVRLVPKTTAKMQTVCKYSWNLL